MSTKSAPASVVVFDLDHTLTAFDTSADFFRARLLGAPWRGLLLLVLLPLLLPLLLWQRTRTKPFAVAAWIATLGCRLEHLPELVQPQVQRWLSGSRTVLLGAGLARLDWHLAQGHTVVIATGSLEVLVRALLDAAGYAHLPVVGSRVRSAWGGLVAELHCVGARKPPALAARGFAPPWTLGYSDSSSDLPMLAQCARYVLVNASARTVARCRAELGEPAEILTWPQRRS